MLAGCREYQVSEDPNLQLAFSCDTLRFDTVFTGQGSATMQMKVYNPHASALLIDRVWLDRGTAFVVNIDGEPDLERITRLQVNGGDSLYVFVRVRTEETGKNSPVLIEDRLHFHLSSGTTQQVLLETYGQDATRIGHVGCGRTDTAAITFTADRPYLLFDTLVVGGKLTIQPGAVLYMHQGACIYALSNVEAKGTKDHPILIRGDRLDRLFDSVPYLYAGGSWNGIYLQAEYKQYYHFEYVDILSANIGLYCFSTNSDLLPQLTMNACRIHNHTLYGLVLLNTDALVTNTEISNCASYCVYCAGGTQDFVHSTIASYFGHTDIRIQSAGKEEAAAVYIDNLSKKTPETRTSFYNSIITGYRANQLVVATPFDRYYPGVFKGNYLKTDTLQIPHASDNTYWQETDTAVFRNDFYKYKEYIYYDFRLDSISPAIGIGDTETTAKYAATGWDRDGVSREGLTPDAGCYQYLP